MTVKAILSRKGYDVATIPGSATIAEAAEMLTQRRIGAVIVTREGDRVAGLLSERDIVHVMAREGAAGLAKRVEDVMTRKVVTCSESDTVGSLMERMTSGRFRHLPVVDDERLIAVISIGDVVKYRIEEVQMETDAMREYIATA